MTNQKECKLRTSPNIKQSSTTSEVEFLDKYSVESTNRSLNNLKSSDKSSLKIINKIQHNFIAVEEVSSDKDDNNIAYLAMQSRQISQSLS